MEDKRRSVRPKKLSTADEQDLKAMSLTLKDPVLQLNNIPFSSSKNKSVEPIAYPYDADGK